MADVMRGRPVATRGVDSYRWSQFVTIPNALTGSRFGAGIAIPFLVAYPSVVFLLAVFGAISDYFDGRLARKWGQTTDFGRVLDQITDFVFGFALVYAVYIWEGPGVRNVTVAAVIALFVVGVGILRCRGKALVSSSVSKMRIAIQFFAAIIIIGTHAMGPTLFAEELRTFAYVVLWGTFFLMGWALIGYARSTDS